MPPSDQEEGNQRLAQQYVSLRDDELEKLAGEIASLTDLGKEALRSEIARRGMTLEEEQVRTMSIRPEARDLVRIRRYGFFSDALLAKTILDSAGLECFLTDENVVRMDWFWSNAVGGVKLWVNRPDVEPALAVLDQEFPEGFDAQDVGEFKQPRCPHCLSLDVSFEEVKRPILHAIAFILNLNIPVKRPGWKCHFCGRERWEPEVTESGNDRGGRKPET